jgi:hypothetical protein
MSNDPIARGLAVGARTVATNAAPATTENLHYLRETHMRLRSLAAGDTTQLVIAVIGDSFVQGNYWTQAFTKALQDKYGFAGSGWVGFGFFGTDLAPPYATGGAQPSFNTAGTTDGNARPDLVPRPTFDGTWTAGYNQNGSFLPSLSYARSTTAGDRARFSFPAGHTSARVFYYRSGTAGSFRYSWDGGSTWAATITYDNTINAGVATDLVSVPAGAATLIIEVVSGSVSLGGVDMKSSAAGVRVHKLGISGGATNNIATAASAPGANNNWRIRMADLGAHLIIMGWQTNDQGSAFVPETTFATNMQTIITGLRHSTALPNADLFLTSPPENQRVANAYPMARYSAVTRSLARTNKAAYLDDQLNFGETAADYGSASARPWFQSDLLHPVVVTGGRALANARLEAMGA